MEVVDPITPNPPEQYDAKTFKLLQKFLRSSRIGPGTLGGTPPPQAPLMVASSQRRSGGTSAHPSGAGRSAHNTILQHDLVPLSVVHMFLVCFG